MLQVCKVVVVRRWEEELVWSFFLVDVDGVNIVVRGVNCELVVLFDCFFIYYFCIGLVNGFKQQKGVRKNKISQFELLFILYY